MRNPPTRLAVGSDATIPVTAASDALPAINGTKASARRGGGLIPAIAAQRASPAGREVRYLGGFFLPVPGRAVCVFGAESASDVADVNQRAGVSFTGVLEAVELRRSGPQGEVPASSARCDP